MNAQNVISNAQLAMVAKLTIVYHALFLYISKSTTQSCDSKCFNDQYKIDLP